MVGLMCGCGSVCRVLVGIIYIGLFPVSASIGCNMHETKITEQHFTGIIRSNSYPKCCLSPGPLLITALAAPASLYILVVHSMENLCPASATVYRFVHKRSTIIAAAQVNGIDIIPGHACIHHKFGGKVDPCSA